MNIIVCLDDKGGMMFNSRRQSQDRVLCERILEITAGCKLWMNSYSQKLFAFDSSGILVDDNFLSKADDGDYCFVENACLSDYTEKINKIIIYKWNRVYPADRRFEIPMSDFQLTETYEFKGSSHEKITEEVYVK